MGIMQRDLDGGLTAAIAAMFALLPGLRAAFEAFVPPRHAPPNPPMDAARALLADAEAFLARIRDAHAEGRTSEMIEYPRALEAAMRVPDEWSQLIRDNPTRYECRPFDNVRCFASAVIKLRQAHELIRQRRWWGNRDLGDAWSQIGGLMWDRDDILVVTGGILHSEGVRHRGQEALEKMGVKGGWSVSTSNGIRHAKFLRHEPHTWGSDGQINVPDDLYADVVRDDESGRPVLPDELGHDTLPLLRR